ncbi:MAG: 6-pyruvoyl-tetrahydropterin synthase-related protein [Syntrophobacteraceae bacterium]
MSIIKRLSIPILVLLAIEALLLLYFPPSLILAPTLTAGGDTPSHFMSALAMRNPSSFFSPVTWMHGNFAGFPLFLQYFPLPFVLMALISFVSSMQVAFKLVTLLAIVPLPAAVYYCLRRMGFRGLVPALGAVLALPFLIQSGNQMWGGNIASTLAGEFAYGISFTLTVVFWGKLYADAPERGSLATNSLIEALIALGNGYPILQAGIGSGYFLVRGVSVRYILAMHALAFGLIGFWILPLIRFISWNTPYPHTWAFQTPLEVAPILLWPSIAGALIGLAPHLRRLPGLLLHPGPSLKSDSGPNPEQYLWWQFGVSLLCFGLAPHTGTVDVRFVPFAQIALAMLGAIGWGKFFSRLPRPGAWLSVFAAAIIVFSVSKSALDDSWIRYNYSGMEAKPLWNSFSEINRLLDGSENSPRVVFEHSDILNGAGSTRAFELLPYFAGRSTLEGLYMQSSITAPFVFHIQSEISQTPSTPLPGYYYSRFNPDRAAAHLRLFNTNQLISVSDNVHNGLDDSPDFEFQTALPPFRVYLVKDAENSYVAPLHFRPFRVPDADWKRAQFEWFRKSSLKVPMVVASESSTGDFWKTLDVFNGPPADLPEIPIAGAENVTAKASLSENRIAVTTSTPGHPLWLKVSYHPSWRIARGGGELYPASPTFMLLVPKGPEVVLEFDTSGGVYLLGKILSLIALVVWLGIVAVRLVRGASPKGRTAEAAPARDGSPSGPGPTSSVCAEGPEPLSRPPQKIFPANARFVAAAALIAVAVILSVYFRSDSDPLLIYNKANAKFERTEKIRADIASGEATPRQVQERKRLVPETIALLDRSMAKFPDSHITDHCFYLKAALLLDEMGGSEYRAVIEDFLGKHPDTRVMPECYYLVGESFLREGDAEAAAGFYYGAALAWPDNTASRQAGIRLTEILGRDAVYQDASQYFESGKYLPAYSLYRALISHADEEVRDPSILALAYCCLYLNRWEEASGFFTQWLGAHFDSPEAAEAEKALRQATILDNQNNGWKNAADDDMPQTTIGKILKLFDLAA